MPAGPGGSQEGQDQEVLKLTICLLILLVLLIALARMQEERANALIGAIAWLHVLPFAEMARLLPWLMEAPVIGPWFFLPMVQAHDFVDDGGFAMMSPEARALLMAYSARAATVLYGPWVIRIAIQGLDVRPDQKYRNAHTLESMIRMQSDDWVTSRHARHVDPSRMPDLSARSISVAAGQKIAKAGATVMPGLALPRKLIAIAPDTWNRALRPEEWLVSRGLAFNADQFRKLSAPEAIVRDADFSFRDDWQHLQINSLSEALAQQLRRPWTGPQDLRPCHQALFAVMAMFYDFDVKGGNALLSDIALLADGIRWKRGLDEALLADPGIMPRIARIVSGLQGRKLSLHADKHAWLESAFPTFLSVSRKDRGVLPAAAFLWLKVEDRPLWYILNSVGGEAVMVEAAGAISHWRAECQIGTKIRRPATFQAARALLEDYLDQRPERVRMRNQKLERRKTPSDQILSGAVRAADAETIATDPDGIDEGALRRDQT